MMAAEVVRAPSHRRQDLYRVGRLPPIHLKPAYGGTPQMAFSMSGTPILKPGSQPPNPMKLLLSLALLALATLPAFAQGGNRVLSISGTNTTSDWALQKVVTYSLTGPSTNT